MLQHQLVQQLQSQPLEGNIIIVFSQGNAIKTDPDADLCKQLANFYNRACLSVFSKGMEAGLGWSVYLIINNNNNNQPYLVYLLIFIN